MRTLWQAIATFSLLLVCGCPSIVPDPENPPGFSNTSDSTNGGARYIGSTACRLCHADISAQQALHGHAQTLSGIRGEAPAFPGTSAGVPDPPAGFAWSDISYVIGGYVRSAYFLDGQGYLLTTGLTSAATQWNPKFGANGTNAGFAPYLPDATAPTPFTFDCIRCHVTGAIARDADNPRSQDNRQGIEGTWVEAGVQCEACHGPGSNHFRTVAGRVVIDRTRIFVDATGTDTCAKCHGSADAAERAVIRARDGFIEHYEQDSELRVSGGHSSFKCTICHDPHRSTAYDRAVAIRNECTSCHTTATPAGHAGKVLRIGDYVEPVTCVSCHMPFAGKLGTSAATTFAGAFGRVGDVRSHIFRINTATADFRSFFSADGSQVQLDAQGKAAYTVDFICLRCHNGVGTFPLTPARAAEIAPNVHRLP
ncbi:MAG: multiheme c-type cytochrome [Phycisphaerae bacterium]